jgi:hypothetical protein
MSNIEKALEDLSLVEIDIAIAVLLKRYTVTVHSIEKLHCCKIAIDREHNSFPFRPSTEHSDGGPIAEQYKIGVAWEPEEELWVSMYNMNGKTHFAKHEQMLAAQMLVLIKAHCGMSVTVPVLA